MDDDCIGYNGMEKLASDLGVDPNDIIMFIICYQLGSSSLLQITKTEFIDGLSLLKYAK